MIWLLKAKSAVQWVGSHAYIVVAVIGTFVVYGVMRRGPTPGQKLQVELDAVAAQRAVEAAVLAKGAEAAHADVAQKYKDHLATLSDEQRDQADKLRGDPAALAAFLVRAAGY